MALENSLWFMAFRCIGCVCVRARVLLVKKRVINTSVYPLTDSLLGFSMSL